MERQLATLKALHPSAKVPSLDDAAAQLHNGYSETCQKAQEVSMDLQHISSQPYSVICGSTDINQHSTCFQTHIILGTNESGSSSLHVAPHGRPFDHFDRKVNIAYFNASQTYFDVAPLIKCIQLIKIP